MVDNNKISLYSGGSVTPNQNMENIPKNLNEYRSAIIWDVLKSFDKDKSKSLDAKEISIFVEQVSAHAGEDRNLDEHEASKLAKKLGVSIHDLMRAIGILDAKSSAEVLLDNISKDEQETFDKSKVTDVIANIDEYSVTDVWNQYQRGVDIQNSSLIGVIPDDKNASLAKDIMKNFSFEDALPLLEKIFDAMCQKAQSDNIEVSTLVEKYNEAKQKQDKNAIDTILREFGARLENATRIKDMVDNYVEKYNIHTEISAEMDAKTRSEINNYAKDSNVSAGDIEGDGILGNSPSKVTKVDGKIQNKEAEYVLNAVNELMQDPIIKEKMLACVRKENGILAVGFPGAFEFNEITENSLTYGDNPVGTTVVGDSDMTAFVHTILKIANGAGKSGLKFNDFNNKEALKAYIMELVEPDVTNPNRLHQKGTSRRKALDIVN